MVRVLVINNNDEKVVVSKIRRLISKQGSFDFALVLGTAELKLEWPLPTYVMQNGVRELHGLNVAFACNDKEVEELRKKEGVDVLVTGEGLRDGGADVSKLITTTRPRYHFYGAASFSQKCMRIKGADYGTRVIAVGSSGRWMYAADITALSKMSVEARRATLPKTLADKSEVLGKRKRDDVCWFCLENKVEQHLIIGYGKYSYIAIARGAVNEGHLLIVANEHVRGCGEVSENALKEMLVMKEGVKKYYQRHKNSEAMFFEWCGQSEMLHMAIQAVAVRREVCSRVASTFRETAKRYNVDVEVEEETGGCMELVRQRKMGNYFWAEFPGNNRVVVELDETTRLPANIGRVVVTKVLGVPQRADWRKCIKEQTQEQRLVNAIAEEMSDYVSLSSAS